jgi:hypothetical protein
MWDHDRPAKYSVILAVLTGLFVLRVVGQVLVAFLNVQVLPPMDRWYSGLLPYQVLLPIQLVMIATMTKIVADVSRGHGYFASPKKVLGWPLRWFSYVYAFAMALRYAVTMVREPERRWLTGTIPIWFHFVLAIFLYTLSHYHIRLLQRRRLNGEI